jgi:membrane peptidoglycan carboxypeptidase
MSSRAYDDDYDSYESYDSYEEYEDTYATESYQPAGPATGPASARAAVPAGGAVSGRASVTTQPARPRYDWSGGGAGRVSGRATVPVSPAVSPAAGRMSVRPEPGGPGGPPATRPAVKKKRHRLRNSLLIALAVMVIMAGGGMVGLSYFVDSVPIPENAALPQGSTIYYGSGERMAVVQEVNREIIDTTVPELANVRNAVVAAEDKNFYNHSGVDFIGIARALIGNSTGGERSGASTIDMQYTRAATGNTEDSYTRKLTEAAQAYKLNQEYSKEEILDFYLNTVYFGRGAYGAQAAARAYFGKSADELSVEEAAVLAGVIRIPDDGAGLSPYDPLHNPDDQSVALERWNYVLDQMVDMGTLDGAARGAMTELPEAIEPQATRDWYRGHQGNIVRQVMSELEEMGITDLRTGGYRITTTIDREIQHAALNAVRRTGASGEDGGGADYWNSIPKRVKAALVAIDPATGAVLAYYGGNDGTGIDMAGPYERDGEIVGGWNPGSSFKPYTLVAELREGVSFDSHWKTSPYHPDWIDDPDAQIQNAGRLADVGGCEGAAPDFCTLRWVTQESYNVPFVQFSERVADGQGPAKVLDAAMDAGITMMQDTNEDSGEYVDLTDFDLAETTEHFFHTMAIGQNPITVLDHATGMATLANRGVYNNPHFVAKVEQKVDGEWVTVRDEQIAGDQRIEQAHADAITQVLAEIPDNWGFALPSGRDAAAKTGTWEHLDENGLIDGNQDAWVVGYTPQIATAVWVGDPRRREIVDEFGNDIGSTGLPAYIWQKFLDDAHNVKEYELKQFPPAPPVGNPQHPLATGEQPVGNPGRGNDNCDFPYIFCDDQGDGDQQDNGNGDGDGQEDQAAILPTTPLPSTPPLGGG